MLYVQQEMIKMATKLTLSADESTIQLARKLAKKHHTSISSLFARFTVAMARMEKTAEEDIPSLPIVSKASGLISLPPDKPAHKVLQEALAAKYGVSQ